MSRILDEHRGYLSDDARVSAYRAAIRAVVKRGSVVLDLGAGTGIMGLLACEAGAERVYSIEANSIIGLTREICRANRYGERMQFIRGVSTEVSLPEKVDVVVSDQIGHFGFEAGILDFFSDARQRFLKPGGILIPSKLDLYVVPVESDSMYRQVDFWSPQTAGFDFTPVRSLAVNTGYATKYRPDEFLGAPIALPSIDLMTASNTSFRGEVCTVVAREGTLHGFGGWFAAQLSPQTILTNSPLAPEPVNRRNAFYPIERPVDVVPGDRIRIALHIIFSETIVTWNVRIVAADGNEKASFRHSTWSGMLVAEEDLRRTQPQSIPRLSRRGEARLTVLTLCDGTRTLAEVEAEMYKRYPDLFPMAAQAARFVSEVVTRYTL